MSEKKERHVHKFKRLIYKSGNSVFFCTLPDCSFKINPALALGKRSICWRCGESFLMSEYSLRLAKPHCDSCHRPKKIELENGSIINLIGENEETYKSTESLSLAERLNQTIQNAKQQTQEQAREEDEI